VGDKRCYVEAAQSALHGQDSAAKARAYPGRSAGVRPSRGGAEPSKCFRWECDRYPETIGLRHEWLQEDE
jgi:hypothetical protein